MVEVKKLLGILVLGLLACATSFSHDKENIFFLNCKGKLPGAVDAFSNQNTETILKIDLKKSKIIFSDGYEFKSNRKWDIDSSDFDTFGGTMTNPTLERRDHVLNIFINRFDGVGMFYYSKTKKSDWPLIKEKYKVKCTKVDREF